VGASIRTLAIDPTAPRTIYAGTGGGVFKSTDGGVTWSAVSIIEYATSVVALEIDPTSSQTIYAVTSRKVFKSTDAGGSWSGINGGLTDAGYLKTLAIDPISPQTIYAGASYYLQHFVGGVFKSTDGGVSWSSAGLANTNVSTLAIDPLSPQTVYAGTNGALGVGKAGLYKSTDGGSSWSSTGLTNTDVRTVVIDPISPQTIYASTNAGVFKSTDAGVNWSSVNTGLTSTGIYALAIDPTSPETIYAGSFEGVYKSTNGGDSWSAANMGLTTTWVNVLAIDPTSPQTIYTGTDVGVFKSTNASGNWNASNTGLSNIAINTLAIDPTSTQTIYAGSNLAGVFKSTNGCNAWNAANTGLTSTGVWALVIDPSSSQTIYAVTHGGVFKSTDAGGNWSSVNTGLTTTVVRALVIDPTSPQTIYAGTYDEGVFRSTDAGGNWNSVNTGLTSTEINALAIDPTSPRTIYAGTYPAGMFKSTNGGDSWSAINSGLPLFAYIRALAIDPTSPETIYAGTDVGVFKSTDAGGGWSNTGLIANNFDELAMDPTSPRTIYAGTGGGVFKSTDGGGSWSTINTGLTNINVDALAIDPKSPQKIYAGINDAGVWVYLPPCPFLSAGGAIECETIGAPAATRAGYAKLAVNSGAAPYGTAVFSYRQNGITVTEAGVAASPPTIAARIFIDYRSGVEAVPGRSDSGAIDIYTGIAIVNYGSGSANVTYTLRDQNGIPLSLGHGTLPAGEHFAKFINQLQDVASDFLLPSNFQSVARFGSLQIDSDQPISVLAMRMTINQRGEAIFTTTPIADLSQPASYSPTYFADFADGSGYTTSVVLLNTTNAIETGTLQVRDKNGVPLVVNQVGGTADSLFRYSILPGGAFHFQTDGAAEDSIKIGWVQLTPDDSTSVPAGTAVFSYNPGSILVSETGIPAVSSTNHARVYVDLAGNHDTGLAIANINDTAASIRINAFETDGVTEVGISQGTLELYANGQDAEFADTLISDLPAGFKGVLDISSATPFAALTMRSLLNERNDFLMTTFPVADMNRAAPSPIVFPQVADGGGYFTEFIFISAGEAADTILSYHDDSGALVDLGQ